MLGFQSLILNLFMWLAFLVPQNFEETKEVLPVTHEDVVMTWRNQSPAIVELISSPNPLLDTTQDTKLPLNASFDKIRQVNAVAYEPRLLYFHIGNAIELQLNSTTIIFPFHCFT